MEMQQVFAQPCVGSISSWRQGCRFLFAHSPMEKTPTALSEIISLRRSNNFWTSNTVDFIQFKAKLLAEEGKNEPIRKAETIREIVQSISIIPDAIRREVYIQSCASLDEYQRRCTVFDSCSVASKKGTESTTSSKIKRDASCQCPETES